VTPALSHTAIRQRCGENTGVSLPGPEPQLHNAPAPADMHDPLDPCDTIINAAQNI
jgi:hypothetical protein